MKRAISLVALMFSIAASVYAQGIEIGASMENFSLTDLSGKVRTLDELKGKNGSVVIFVSAQCPVVKGYDVRINEIAADYSAKGINFIGINANATESLEWVTSDAEKVGYKFPVLIDKGNVLADKLGATVTPEVYYLNSENKLLYHGAIDNDRSGKAITTQYLRTAFDASLSGKKIERARAAAFGCTIKKVKAD